MEVESICLLQLIRADRQWMTPCQRHSQYTPRQVPTDPSAVILRSPGHQSNLRINALRTGFTLLSNVWIHPRSRVVSSHLMETTLQFPFISEMIVETQTTYPACASLRKVSYAHLPLQLLVRWRSGILILSHTLWLKQRGDSR